MDKFLKNKKEFQHLFIEDKKRIYECTPKIKTNGLSHLQKCILMMKTNPSIYKYIVEHLEKSPENINYQNKKGLTALMIACANQLYSIILLLLKHGSDPNIKDNQGWTALMLACNHGTTVDSIKLLIEKGADVNIVNSRGNTALIYSVINDSIDTIDLLFGSQINTKNENAENALIIACKNMCNIKIIQKLLENGADPNCYCEEKRLIRRIYDYYISNQAYLEIIGTLILYGANMNEIVFDKALKQKLKSKGFIQTKNSRMIQYINSNEIKKGECQICYNDDVAVIICKNKHRSCLTCLDKIQIYKCEFCCPR